MATELYTVEGDTAPSRIFTITRGGVAVNLTGKTVKLIIRDTSTNNITNAGHQELTVVSAAAGTAQYNFQAGDIASGNIHMGDIIIDSGGGSIETDYDQIIIHARPKVSTVS